MSRRVRSIWRLRSDVACRNRTTAQRHCPYHCSRPLTTLENINTATLCGRELVVLPSPVNPVVRNKFSHNAISFPSKLIRQYSSEAHLQLPSSCWATISIMRLNPKGPRAVCNANSRVCQLLPSVVTSALLWWVGCCLIFRVHELARKFLASWDAFLVIRTCQSNDEQREGDGPLIFT